MKTRTNCRDCIRECQPGHSFCNRKDVNGDIIANYRFCALTVDNLFDKPIRYYNGNSRVLSIGSWGCNLRCLGCQNSNLSWAATGDDIDYLEMNSDQIVEYACANNCRGICFTFNEPAIIIDEVEQIAVASRARGLFNVLVTNSTLTRESACRIGKNIDAVAADIKSMNDKFYYDYCGAIGIEDVAKKILDCILTLSKSGCHIEVRTNLINGANDQYDNLVNTALWIRNNLGSETAWHITRFFPAHRLSHLQPTSAESLEKAKSIGMASGLNYVHCYTEKGCDCAGEDSLVGQSKEGINKGACKCCGEQGP